jgi:beta-fructofuranosidase
MDAQAARAELAADPHRPRYHFTSPRNWMNDPNGFIQFQGTYHLFYQHNPASPLWGNIHWGHATSSDLVHWRDEPIALSPTPGGPDEDGCWSGATVIHEGTPTIIYSGSAGGARLPCLAVSHDGMRTWDKYEGNPLIPQTPEGLDLIGYRDHVLWREQEHWYHLIGAGIQNEGGAALLYRSKNLLDWEYLHPLMVGDAEHPEWLWTGTMWECPDFFPLGDRHVLSFSVWHEEWLYYSVYLVGAYHDQRFYPRSVHKLDHGDKHFYAPQSLLDDQGRRITMGWIQEGRSQLAVLEAGWAGAMSLPRILTMREDGRLGIEPIPELQQLRGKHHRFVDIRVPEEGHELPLQGDTLELIAEFDLGTADQVGLKLRASPDGVEETLLLYDRQQGHLLIDRTRASLDEETERTVQGGAMPLDEGQTLRLHLFLDRSVVECFANGHTVLTSRIYPSRPDSQKLYLVARGGATHLKSLDVWEMRSIWNDMG